MHKSVKEGINVKSDKLSLYFCVGRLAYRFTFHTPTLHTHTHHKIEKAWLTFDTLVKDFILLHDTWVKAYKADSIKRKMKHIF